MAYNSEPTVTITHLSDDEIKFRLRDTTLAMANAFRR